MPGSASWVGEPCPSWCTVIHRDDDHIEDRRHRSEGVGFHIALREVDTSSDPLTERVHDAELDVGLSRGVDERTTWVFIGVSAARSLEIDSTDARRLRDELTRILGPDSVH